ncbi:MAG: type II toxin-antitoxin system prevent-host-death family antitoxin [Hyphomicrobium aestuarii]|nr:type II toxin-antitoxin system prevent-host-death family antitoxin [Hyphomicrobium aestuarii]
MPDIITLHAAKTQLSKLVKRVEQGEEIIIARGDTPVARLVPLKPEAGRPPLGFGLFAGTITGGDSLLEPLSDEDLELIENGHPDDPLKQQ